MYIHIYIYIYICILQFGLDIKNSLNIILLNNLYLEKMNDKINLLLFLLNVKYKIGLVI